MCCFIKSKYLFFNIKSFLKSSEYIKNSLISSIFPKFDEIAPSFVVIFPKFDEIAPSFVVIFPKLDEIAVVLF